MGFTTVTFCTALLVLANAGPVYKRAAKEDKSVCALTCTDNNKFNYELGNVYEFSYNAKTTTKMNGASEDAASINMSAKVEIEPLTKCDFVMRIKDASIRDSQDDKNSRAFSEPMIKQPVKFSFQDGRIDHICPMDGESTWTLNIKRGILSAFQNTMNSFDRSQNLTETDVVGTCVSEYKVVKIDYRNNKMKKTKNLRGCVDREGYRMAVQFAGYGMPSFVQSLSLMKSEYECMQALDVTSRILQSSTCSEEHVFGPFSNGKNGAMTTSEQTLTFTKKKKAKPSSKEHFSQRSTLLFHHQHFMPSEHETGEKIEAKLQELCLDDIRPEVPEIVNQLIEHMRLVDQYVLQRIYSKILQKKICPSKTDRIKQFFFDAIPLVGTAASVGMIKDLISRRHIIGSEAEMWLLSLSFAHHPTKEMVAAAMPLLDEPELSGNNLLAVSSLASSYCKDRPDCGKDSEISALINKLIDFTNDCNAHDGDARTIVFALRAIGNIGRSHAAVSHLIHCSTREDVPIEIRIAAMGAFRRVPCDAMRSDLMGVFRDESEDSELRLNAYIALMKCPTQNVLSEVRQVLEKEKSNQVGSFVWTHLTNLMETSDPHMQDIRNIVQDEELKKEFNLDQRKFSRNYEGSFFLDSINTGAKADSNVIFSEKSFIPRSANLNLTVDLFGYTVNFLEFGGRVQGMERILENFFGPSGTKTPSVKSKAPFNLVKSMDDFRGSAFLRVFGNELRYWDDKSLNELQSSLRKLMNMQSLSFSKSMQLIDSRMIIPTCIGLPLNLTMTATGSIFLDAKASFQRSEVNVNFKPSASVQVKGEMSVDAHVSKAGLKMVTITHTSTEARLDIRNNKFDLQIPQKKMEIFNLKTDFYIIHRNTEKKQKMIVDNVKKHEICTGNSMKQVTGLTFCQNIKFPIASSKKEAPFFPFTGPVVYDLYMMNEDAPNGYQIEGFTKQLPYSFYMDTPNSKVSRRIALDTVMKNKNEAHITFTAPWKNLKIEGTVVNTNEMKKVTGEFSLDGRTDYILLAQLGMKNTKGLLSFTPKFEVTIPKKKMIYEGKIEVMPMKSLMIDMSASGFIASDINLKVSGEIVPKEIGFTTQLRIGKKEYYIATRLGKLISKSGFKYTPSLKITIPGKDLVEFTSEILYESNKKMSFDFKLNKVLPKTVAMNAHILLNAGKTKTKHILRVLFKSSRGNFRINGDVDNKKTGITSRVIGSYNFGAKYSDRLTLSSKIRNLSVKKSVRYMGNVALASKKQEFLNFNLKGQLAKAINHLETKFDLRYGNPKIKTNNLKFTCVLNRALKPFIHAYEYTMTIQHPGQKINYKVEANHVQSAKWPFKKFENTVVVQMAPGKVVQTKLSYSNAKIKGLPTHESEISLSYPGRDMKITDKLTQVNKNTYENDCIVQWQKGQEVVVQSKYTKSGKDIHNIENTLRLPNKKEVKATAMLQVMPGAYKAKAEFSADKDVIYRQQINYKAEGGVTYAFNAKQISSGIIGEIMWAPNQKVAANINFDYMKKSSLSGKLAFSTPFDAMKNFDSDARFTWANSKYTSTMTASWNNRNELKQDFSFVYPDFHISYDASAHLSGKKSEVGLVMKYSDMSLNGNIKVSHDKATIIDVLLKHNAQKMGFESEMGLDFDILDSSGKMKITLEYDLRKGVLMSNGEGKLNLPLVQLRQIGASYNLKHNNDLTSIDMSYSSSLGNYRNGKVIFESRRNLPNMLKTKMDMTFNDKPLFNINANYGNQKDNIDMKIDIVEPSGQKITVSGNINLSGSRKTGNVELKSRYINLSADGAFEYQGTRSASGELKMTAEGKSVMIKANYKKEGSTYKITGTLGLPDGRSLKMEGSLDLQNIAASLKTMTPDFPELTGIDMAFSFNGDKRMFNSAASLKVMPYFDTAQVEMKLTKKQFIVEMKTHFDSMEQAKVAVSFDGDWVRSQKVKVVFQLNNEEMVDLDMNNNFNGINDFVVSITALTSHRRYKEFQFELKNKGPLSNIQSSLKIKFANVLMLDAMFQNSRKASKVSLDAQLSDFDEWKSTFELKGDLDAMTAKIITNIAKKEVNRIDVSLKEYGRSINIKVKGPKAVNFDFDMDLDTEAITFNMESSFTQNGHDKYDISASYEHLSKLQMKTSIPSYQNELLITFSGNLKAFNAQTKFSHNNQMYELMLSNKDYYRQIKGNLNTPYFKDTASFSFDGEFSEMNILAHVMHNKDKFELTFSNKGYYQQINAKLVTPYFQSTIIFSLIGNLEKFNFGLEIGFNKQIYEMKASNEDYFRKMNFLLDTPFLNCDFQFEGDLVNTKGTFTVMYGNTKYELNVSNKNFFQDCSLTLNIPKHMLKVNGKMNIKKKVTGGNFNIIYNKKKLSLSGTYKDLGRKKILKADLKTPYFKDSLTAVLNGKAKTFNAQIKLIHNGKSYELTISNKNFYEMIDLNIYAPGMEAKINFEGELKKFKSFASVKIMNDMYRFGLSNDDYVRSINMDLATPQTGNFVFGYDLQDNFNSFKLISQLSYMENSYELNVLRDIKTEEHRLTIVSPQINVNGHFNGDFKSFSFDANVVFNEQKYELMASTKNYFREISGKLTTPQFGEQSLSVKINGQMKDFSCFIEVKNNKDIYRSDFSLKDQDFHLSLPKWLKKVDMKLTGNLKSFDFNMLVMNYIGESFEISVTNKNFREMSARVTIPDSDDIDVSVKTRGNLRNGEATMKMSFGESYFENEAKINFDDREATLVIEPHYMILGRSGKSKLKIDLMFEAQSYKYEIEAEIEGIRVKSTAAVKISPEINILITINIPTFDESEIELHFVSSGFQKIGFMLKLKTPWTKITNISYQHSFKMEDSFSNRFYIEREGKTWFGYTLYTSFSGEYRLSFKGDYFKNRIMIKGDLKFQGHKTEASMSISTTFQAFKEITFYGISRKLPNGVLVELTFKIPNHEYNLNIDLRNDNFKVLLKLNMDQEKDNKQCIFSISSGNNEEGVFRSFNLTLILPERTVSVDFRFDNLVHNSIIEGNFTWDKASSKNVGFELKIIKDEPREIKLRIITPGGTTALYNRVHVDGNRYSSVSHIMMDELHRDKEVYIKTDTIFLSDRADIDLIVKFPNQKKGMNLKTSINFPKGDIIFSSTSEFSMDQDPKKSLKMSTKLMSETKGKRQMYTLQMDAGHAQSGFATELVGRLSSTPEKYNADVEMGYLTMKGNQQKFAIRGEVHRLNREVNLKLEGPSKTIELDGSLSTRNQYLMSILKKETGKENMEAIFKLNPQKMNIIFNYDEADPEKLYHIDADIVESTITFLAYRTEKEHRESVDGKITAEIRVTNIFYSYINWNPDLLEELNAYNYQRLNMYRKELKSVGDFLNQVLNDEFSMKFALIKQSFSKDMAPISDYFATEYKKLSKDFAETMQLMNQMFKQDSFYMKSAAEAICNVRGGMWLSYDKCFITLKQEFQVFIENIDKKMDLAQKQFVFYYGQYSMQLRNKVNELFVYYQEQYKMLCERTIEMKDELVAFMKSQPKTTNELIDWIRPTPFGKKVAEFISEMYGFFNKITIDVRERINSLTSAIYSAHARLNRHIVEARRYPYINDFMESVDRIYTQVVSSYNWNLKDRLLKMENTLHNFGAEKIKEIKSIINDFGINTFFFDFKRGEIMIEIHYSAAKYFYENLKINVKTVKRVVRELKRLLPNLNLNVWDIYYKMKPSTDLDDYILPFNAEATLFAGQYITTFDGRHLDYNGRCSFLLTHDFVDGNFTVVANVDDAHRAKRLKSLSVTTAHREHLEIFPDNKVSLNRRIVKLPLQLIDATVTLKGNLVVVESKRGYKVMCDHEIQLYTVQISGWYFNKVAGLFGNYNNEPRDDMTMSNGRHANLLNQFAISWSVSRECRIHRRVAPGGTAPDNKECAHFFSGTDSPFRYCFRQVNPAKFYKTCAMQLSSSETISIDLCNVTSFYQKKCQKKGVYLSTPIMCPKKM